MTTLLRTVATIALVSLGVLAMTPALAQHHRHGGWHGHGWHGGHGGGRIGIYLGGPLFAPSYYPPPYYYAYPPTVYVQPAAPTVYVERSDLQAPLPPAPHSAPPQSAQAAPTPPQAADWYFCAESNAYYPYVRECASTWQRVAPQPPSLSR
ncbi:MAG: hypothetical protein H7125_17295 [Proteobacteria bacterium]|nr:hypothetical protein [Burkholderiales bacterium]